jgi:hypothetical protein
MTFFGRTWQSWLTYIVSSWAIISVTHITNPWWRLAVLVVVCAVTPEDLRFFDQPQRLTAGRFWSSNGRPGGVIEIPDDLDDDEYAELRDLIDRWCDGHARQERRW